jgi:hypothetical protein
MKPNARKVRKLGDGIGDRRFRRRDRRRLHAVRAARTQARATDGQLLRAAVELAKDWRTDKYLRNLEAMMIVADKEVTRCPDRQWRRAGAGRRHRGDRIGRQFRAVGGARAGRLEAIPRRWCARR